MSSLFVKPRQGGRVRMPERNFAPMGEGGAKVALSDYYQRLILGGDVIVFEPPTVGELAEVAVAADPPWRRQANK